VARSAVASRVPDLKRSRASMSAVGEKRSIEFPIAPFFVSDEAAQIQGYRDRSELLQVEIELRHLVNPAEKATANFLGKEELLGIARTKKQVGNDLLKEGRVAEARASEDARLGPADGKLRGRDVQLSGRPHGRRRMRGFIGRASCPCSEATHVSPGGRSPRLDDHDLPRPCEHGQSRHSQRASRRNARPGRRKPPYRVPNPEAALGGIRVQHRAQNNHRPPGSTQDPSEHREANRVIALGHVHGHPGHGLSRGLRTSKVPGQVPRLAVWSFWCIGLSRIPQTPPFAHHR
jgi:hypothetical protein